MRTLDQEKFLVGFVNDLLNRFHRGFDVSLPMLQFPTFRKHVMLKHDTELRDCLLGMTPEKLGIIVALFPASWETMDSMDLFQTRPTGIPTNIGEPSKGGGRFILVDIALPIVIAAMYDVFAARCVILDKRAHAWRNTAERSQSPQIIPWPKEAMMKVVKPFLG